MAEDLVSRLRDHCDTSHIPGLPCDWLGTKCFNCESADEIERLRKELTKWATTPPNRMVCTTHGEMFMCFDDYMGGVFWCEGCKNG